jgi:hypothetical protein
VLFYRLKGCGNYVDGEYAGKSLRFEFPGMPVVSMEKLHLVTFEADEAALEVRGVAFHHTACRELFMASLVHEALRPVCVPCALKPAAVVDFDCEPLPRLPKSCAVSQTLGERRVASHLIPGLRALIPLLWGSEAPDFPATRAGPFDFTDWSTGVTTTHAVVPTFVVLKRPHGTEELVDAASMASLKEPCGAVASGVTESLAEPWRQRAFERACHEWVEACGPAQEALADREGAARSVMAHLWWRIGREAGLIRGAMTRAGISWGNYMDHIMEPHNNSHPNNLVVLPPGGCPPSEWSALLAPLDLDMSYTRESFFLNATGEPDPAEFEQSLSRERDELLFNLAGDASSTGLAGIGLGEDTAESTQVLHWALRDTMALGFLVGYRLGLREEAVIDPHPSCAASDRACRALTTMALVLSASNVS